MLIVNDRDFGHLYYRHLGLLLYLTFGDHIGLRILTELCLGNENCSSLTCHLVKKEKKQLCWISNPTPCGPLT